MPREWKARQKQFQSLKEKIESCERCPRLRRHCLNVAKKKKREFQTEPYWGLPVPGFGDLKAKIWIVGLAPAAHGANRTGRIFTGDSSGNWLYRGLYQAGFSNQALSTHREDGLSLEGVFVSCAGRCAPPENKPTTKELQRCSVFLNEEWHLLKEVQIFLALGRIAYGAVLHLLRSEGIAIPSPTATFGHGKWHRFGPYTVVTSYHPSRQNTQTGRLTEPMWQSIFDDLAKWRDKETSGNPTLK